MDLRDGLLIEVLFGIDPTLTRRPALFLASDLAGATFTMTVTFGYEMPTTHTHSVDLNEPESLHSMSSWLARVLEDPEEPSDD